MLEELWQDTRYASRSLTNAPGFTAVAVCVLALGIGVNAAIFNLVNMLMLRPVMIEDPERMVGVYSEDTERPAAFRSFSYPNYLDLREQNTVFSELAAHTITIVGLAEGDATRRVMAGLVSSNYFATFGVPMVLGRSFIQEEESSKHAPVMVISHDFWQRRGGDAATLGSTLTVNGNVVTVVGITAAGFTGSTALFSPDLWLPFGFYDSVLNLGSTAPRPLDDRENYSVMLFGKLREDLPREQAQKELTALAARLEEAYPRTNENQTITLSSMPRLSISDAPENDNFLFTPLLMLMAMAGVVLLIACLNLANMFLARGASRRTEIAVRVSLGGGRSRLIRQLLTESLLLSLIGGAVGLVLAYASSKLLFSSLGGLLPFGVTLLLDVRPDVRVLLATMAFCGLATLFFGFGPAWKLTGLEVFPGLKEGAGADGVRSSRHFYSPRNLMIVGQIALSLVLLVAGGLFIRGALAAADANPGFSLDESILVELDPSLIGKDELQSREVYRDVVQRLRALPGVDNAALSSMVPFGSVTSRRRVRETGSGVAVEDSPLAHYYVIGDQYFDSLRLPILRGRDFTDGEASGETGHPVAIIDGPWARQLWPGEEALGRLLERASSTPGFEPVPMEIVGIVPGTRHQFWDPGPTPHLYVPFGQRFFANMNLHVRLTEGMAENEAAMLQTVRQEIRAVDAGLPVLTL